MPPPRRIVVLTLDAFSTIYEPKAPIFAQYLSLARQCNLPLSDPSVDLEKQVAKSFKSTFKEMYAQSPNYGRATGMRPEEWWDGIVRGTFQPLISTTTSTSKGNTEGHESQVEEQMTDLSNKLYTHFSSSSGYTLFPDAKRFFQRLKQLRDKTSTSNHTTSSSTPNIIIGVLTNSDPRVTSVLKSLGLKVGSITATNTPSLPISPSNDIDFVLTSYEAGYEKPSQEIFRHVEGLARRIVSDPMSSSTEGQGDGEGVETKIQHIHIGDDLKKDVLLPKGFEGWQSIYLDRSDSGDGLELSGNVTRIQSLDDETLMWYMDVFRSS